MSIDQSEDKYICNSLFQPIRRQYMLNSTSSRLALAQWSVRSCLNIEMNEDWSSSDDEEEFINKFQSSCFASDSEEEHDDSACS